MRVSKAESLLNTTDGAERITGGISVGSKTEGVPETDEARETDEALVDDDIDGEGALDCCDFWMINDGLEE